MMIYLDVILVFLLFELLRFKNLKSFLSPPFLYLLFHFIFVTIRGIQIFIYDSIIVSNRWFSVDVTLEEIDKAIFIADISLLGFVVGFLLYEKKFIRKGYLLAKKNLLYEEKNTKVLNFYLGLMIALGFFGIINFVAIPGVNNNVIQQNNIYISLLTNLGIISVLALIYEKGFKKIFLIYFLLLLFVFSIQGFHRYRVILPVVFILSYYLKVNKIKFPPLRYWVIGVVIIIFSLPLKIIGKKIQKNQPIDLIEIGLNSIDGILEGGSDDLSFIEQSAAMIGTVDKKRIIFYGETYIPIFFFWIPRTVWNNKPALNQWQYEISSFERDYAGQGQISLLSGESYANFRHLGAFFIPLLIGVIYSYVYYLGVNINTKHKRFLLLLIMNMVLLQVWRDGVISLVIFPFVNYLPLMVLLLVKTAHK